MSGTGSHDELFQQRFASSLSFTLSNPLQSPPLDPFPAPDHGEQQASTPLPLTPSSTPQRPLRNLVSDQKEPLSLITQPYILRRPQKGSYLTRSIQPLLISPARAEAENSPILRTVPKGSQTPGA
jgi:hypothetical protein